ncbi:unnamed protein product [Blepharisma stoltei]|uniref:SH3 domain-containing protein n=1 Tax=Blepharisma stoltei TaxID=1481888 RepID=A0AAU9J1U1_9CILI|nr:unnamed protein product [Blepharisma stoltei]
MENNLPSIKSHSSIKRRFEIAKQETGPKSGYVIHSFTAYQNKKVQMESKPRAGAEGNGKKRPLSGSNRGHYSKWINKRKSDPKEAQTSRLIDIEKTLKKATKTLTSSNTQIICESEESASPDQKSLDAEVERLNLFITSLNETHKEKEEALFLQIQNLQHELNSIKNEFIETVEFLGSLIKHDEFARIPKEIEEKIASLIEKNSHLLNISIENILKDQEKDERLKIAVEGTGNHLEVLEYTSGLFETGKFRSFNDEQYFPEVPKTPSSQICVIALYDYHPSHPEHLEFSAGDRITLLHQLEEGWWNGKLNDKIGKFPSSYVLVD